MSDSSSSRPWDGVSIGFYEDQGANLDSLNVVTSKLAFVKQRNGELRDGIDLQYKRTLHRCLLLSRLLLRLFPNVFLYLSKLLLAPVQKQRSIDSLEVFAW